MRGPTLPFAPMKTYGPIFVNLREKLELLSLENLFLSPLTPTLCLDFPFSFFFLIWIHGSHCAMCPSHIWVHFYLETIYFFSVQFILNELSSSHFLTSEIFIKISSLESLTTYYPENHKKFRLS